MKNIKKILLFIFIFIIVFSIIIVKPINDLDEIWNYNTARAISEGLIPYKDVSMITTPFLPMLTAIFLKIVANEVIVSRAIAAVVWSGIFYTLYKIFRNLIKEENTCFIMTALIGILCRDIFCIDYNVFVLLIALIVLYKELKNFSQCDLKHDFVVGILAGIAICTKQSIGTTLAIVVVLYKVLFIQNKEQIKQYSKCIFYRIMGIFIPVGILFVYLIFTGAMEEFINYAVLGIRTFSNKISYLGLLQSDKIEIRILSILVPISIVLMGVILVISKILKKDNDNIQKILTIFIYSLSIIIVMYPISDVIHFLIGSLISIIGLVYLIYLLGKKLYNKINYNNKYKGYKILTLLLGVFIFVVIFTKAINNVYIYFNIDKNTEIKHYKNIEISESLKLRINEVDKFVQDKEQDGYRVCILDAEAAIYMIPLDKYNKNYDMFLKGNIGKDGEDGIIEKMQQSDVDILYLVRKENFSLNWQTPLEVVKYVRGNLERIGEIGIYDVFVSISHN